jgi:hypothetical protein
VSASNRLTRHKRRPRLYKRKSLLFAVILTCLALGIAYAVLNTGPLATDQKINSKAAIIDQLMWSFPNTTFWFSANDMFNQSGWAMYYYGAASDTVDFYRTLPEKGFKIIILRVHAALNPGTGTLAFFTSEKWDDLKATTDYITDFDLVNPLNNKLAKVRLNETSEAYFGLTPNFVKDMDGDFQDSIIIMMGCDSLANTKMAQAFIQKGAKAYVGWTGPVSAQHTDTATQQLLKHLVSEKKTLGTAVAETLSEVGNDPDFGSTIAYYPQEAEQYKP